MVVPLGERYQQSLVLLKKVNGQLEAEPLQPTFFVPMTGRAEETRIRKNDDGVPRLLNASFEDTDDEDQLLGWYYVRQAKIVSDQEAMHGERFLAFSNEEAGRGAQALQAVGLDGREIATINLSLWIQATTVRPGRSTKELPRVNVSFFDEKQAPCGAQSVGPWYGTITWVKKQAVIQVPPKAKLAVVAVGMFGAVGEFAVDSVELTIGQKR